MTKQELEEKILLYRTGTIRPKRENQFWTKEETVLLRNMFNNGVGISELAITFERSESAISQRLEFLKLCEYSKSHKHLPKEYKKHHCFCNAYASRGANACKECRFANRKFKS